MKNTLEDSINKLYEDVRDMLKAVNDSLTTAIRAVEFDDLEAKKIVLSNDDKIDELRSTIENSAVDVLISQAPYGQYIRKTVAALKMATHLERMADYSCHLTSVVGSNRFPSIKKEILSMANEALVMSDLLSKAVLNFDDVLALQVAKIDDELDLKRKKINEMIIAIDNASLEQREELFNSFFVTKELERLGDRVTSLCAWVVYLKTGKKPKLN